MQNNVQKCFFIDDNGSQQDYKPIDVTAGAFVRPGAGANMASLYNGNIAAMSVNIAALQKGGAGTNAEPLFYQYRYDQLNRLKTMQAFNGLSSNSWAPVAIDDHKEWVVYDPNGNILSYHRKGAPRAGKATEMDQLKYYYDAQTNRLNHVYDSVSNSAYTEDIESQDADNYVYDKIGNLKRDVKEGITGITWNVYGKIQQIVKGSSTITYVYDAAGNRISKTVSATNLTTVYVRDASGNVLSVYEKPGSGSLAQKELQIYGSSRLGLVTALSVAPVDVSLSGSLTGTWRTFVRGEKLFELSNHLGNVLATVSDRKVQVNASGSVGYYTADVKSATDYYPFGMGMVGRSYSSASYRYGFNGQEKSTEIDPNGNSMTAEFWQYDTRLGRRWNIDPVIKTDVSDYAVLGNNPILFVDPNGADWYRDKKSGGYEWFEGSGRRKGFEHMKTGTWSERNANNISYYFGDGKDGLIMDSGNPLENVTVTGKAKPKSLIERSSWGQNFDRSLREAPEWNAGYDKYFVRRRDNLAISQAGDNFYYQSHVEDYERHWQAYQDWRTMSGVAVGILAFPVALEAGVFTGTDMFLVKMGIDFTGQLVVNKGDVWRTDVFDLLLAGFSAPGMSAVAGGAIDFRLNGDFGLVGFNKSWGSAAMDGAFKYFFGGAGQGSVPGIILKKATFSSVMQKWEKEVFLRLLGLPINITGKLARTYTKEKTGQ